MPYPETLTTSRATYERWEPAKHTDGFAELCADPEVMRFLGGAVPYDGAREVSERIGDHWETFGFGLWAVIEPEAGRLAGFSGACRATWHPEFARRTEIGWRLARWAWGRGYATEGGALARAAAGTELGLAQVIALVHPENVRSQAVVRRLGMQVSGRSVDPRLRHPLDVWSVSTSTEPS